MRIYILVAALVILFVVIGAVAGYFLFSGPPEPGESYPEQGIYSFLGTLNGDDDYRIHSFRVNSSATSMRLMLYCGGNNDFDLYGAVNYTPSTYDYMLIGYDIGGEDITYDNPEKGIWHIMVHSFSGAGPYTLNIDIIYE